MPFERRGFGFRREMHKATCADCGQETEVPSNLKEVDQSTVENVIKNIDRRDSNPGLKFLISILEN